MSDMEAAMQRLRSAVGSIVELASDAQTQWVPLQSGIGQLADFRQLAVDLMAAYEREHGVKRRVIGDIGVSESLDTINIYLSALLLEVFTTETARHADAIIETIVLLRSS